MVQPGQERCTCMAGAPYVTSFSLKGKKKKKEEKEILFLILVFVKIQSEIWSKCADWMLSANAFKCLAAWVVTWFLLIFTVFLLWSSNNRQWDASSIFQAHSRPSIIIQQGFWFLILFNNLQLFLWYTVNTLSVYFIWTFLDEWTRKMGSYFSYPASSL